MVVGNVRVFGLAVEMLSLAVLAAANPALADADEFRVQFCWAFGRFDKTVYFAEAEDREDRQANFETLIAISGIDHHPVECRASDHKSHGVALTEFLSWLHEHVAAREASGNAITELEAEDKLLEFRARGEGFVEPSFRSISASAANAAMCHYASSVETNAPLSTKGVYLIDSGGQYLTGTTDVTRTTAFAPVSNEVRRTYTAVLKGFVALMTAQFPAAARGHHLDALARRPLWDLGLDYDHGTGHGVGHFLSVHEHPQRFGKVVNNYEFAPGVIMTIEPGYYREGEFGLRVENQVETVAAAPGFLRFETLTLAPIELSLADMSALTREEIAWIDGYHARVRQALADKLSTSAREWLERMTAPIN